LTSTPAADCGADPFGAEPEFVTVAAADATGVAVAEFGAPVAFS
jgi:hypothetical protein